MNPENAPRTVLFITTAAVVASLLIGCAANPHSGGGTATTATGPSLASNRFVASDGRTIDIGRSTPASGGRRFDNPHMEKGKCWLADGFDFKGFDTLLIAPTLSTAKFPDKPEDRKVHDLAKDNLVAELGRVLGERGIFAKIVTRDTDIPAGAKTLRLENTITEFSKGGGAARYFVGLYGGGQPILRVQGKASAAEKTLFTYEARRSGTSAGARVGGVFMKDEDIQIEDIRSLVLDLTDFIAAIAGKYQPRH